MDRTTPVWAGDTQMVLDLSVGPPHRGPVAIPILSESERAAMHRAGQCAAATLWAVVDQLRPGVTTAQIDAWVREDTAARGATPSQLGYKGFPAAVCTSRNEVVCHGIPRATEVVESGDILNIDVTSELDGFHGDTSVTVCIGCPSPAARHVVEVAQRCLEAGIAAVRAGVRLGDVGAAIEAVAQAHGCEIVREFGGHGIGRRMHQAPHVSHRGPAGRGLRLVAGMALTIEPMVVIGNPGLELLDDGWTVVTRDGSPSAQFEHTIIVQEHGAEITTVRSPAYGERTG